MIGRDRLIDRLFSAVVVGLVVLAMLAAAGPALARVLHELVWPVLVVGLVAAALRGVWFFTRR